MVSNVELFLEIGKLLKPKQMDLSFSQVFLDSLEKSLIILDVQNLAEFGQWFTTYIKEILDILHLCSFVIDLVEDFPCDLGNFDCNVWIFDKLLTDHILKNLLEVLVSEDWEVSGGTYLAYNELKHLDNQSLSMRFLQRL